MQHDHYKERNTVESSNTSTHVECGSLKRIRIIFDQVYAVFIHTFFGSKRSPVFGVELLTMLAYNLLYQIDKYNT